MKYLQGFAIFFALLLLSLSPVAAQSATPSPKAVISPKEAPPGPINLTLSPTFLNLATDPGQPVSSQLKVTNNNNFTEYLKVEVGKYEITQGGERLNILKVTPQDDFAKWISFSEDSFTVDPNQTKNVKFTINPPKDAALGYYYALVVSRIKEQEAKDTAVVTGAPVFSVLLEVRSPNAKRELQLLDFSTDSLFYEYLPTTFTISLKNTGNLHIVPSGDVFVDWGGQKDIAILKANPGRGNVLPQSKRTFDTAWDDGLVTNVRNSKKVYETKFDFSKPLNKFRIGKYTAHLLVVYDNGQRDIPLEATTSFWVIPWKILIGALLILTFTFIGAKSTVMNWVKRLKKSR